MKSYNFNYSRFLSNRRSGFQKLANSNNFLSWVRSASAKDLDVDIGVLSSIKEIIDIYNSRNGQPLSAKDVVDLLSSNDGFKRAYPVLINISRNNYDQLGDLKNLMSDPSVLKINLRGDENSINQLNDKISSSINKILEKFNEKNSNQVADSGEDEYFRGSLNTRDFISAIERLIKKNIYNKGVSAGDKGIVKASADFLSDSMGVYDVVKNNNLFPEDYDCRFVAKYIYSIVGKKSVMRGNANKAKEVVFEIDDLFKYITPDSARGDLKFYAGVMAILFQALKAGLIYGKKIEK